MACQPEYKSFDVQGHRGCRGLIPENTIPAFLHAVDLGVQTLELDVVLSNDGQVVVSHEAFLNPEICLDSQGNRIAKDTVINIYQMDYAEIAQCDCGSLGNPDFPEQEKMVAYKPLLVDVLEAVKTYCSEKNKPLPNFNVEIKSNAKYVFMYHPAISVFADAVVSVLQSNLDNHKYTIQCFDVLTLQYVHRTYPDIKLAYLVEDEYSRTPGEVEQEIEGLGFTPQIYSCYYPMLTDSVVTQLHNMGVAVIPWTVNDKEAITSMINMGVDGIITDYPNMVIDLLNDSSGN
jgi:glycerophosphoryl diester phosphodiesterase